MRSSRLAPALGIVVSILGGLLMLLPLLTGCTDVTVKQAGSTAKVSEESSTSTAFVQQEGEIFLEPAGTAGPESFTGEVFVPAGPTTTFSIPASTTSTQPQTTTTTVSGGARQVASYAGDVPALYGGSKSKERADKEGQLRFLEQNPDKAAAFVAALNSGSGLRWSGGSQVRVDQLGDCFA